LANFINLWLNPLHAGDILGQNDKDGLNRPQIRTGLSQTFQMQMVRCGESFSLLGFLYRIRYGPKTAMIA
jgi:hypothetical protein